MKVKSFSRVRLLATPWTADHQAPASMGFSRQEHWSGVPLPSPSVNLRILKFYQASFLTKMPWDWKSATRTKCQKTQTLEDYKQYDIKHPMHFWRKQRRNPKMSVNKWKPNKVIQNIWAALKAVLRVNL